MSKQTVSNSLSLNVQINQPKPISPDLFGIFFEDINYAADGGLYGELIQNRSFEYSAADQPDWNFFTGWELDQGEKVCGISCGTVSPIHPNNPHYLTLDIGAGEGIVELRNTGFDGIVIKTGDSYNLSLFARMHVGSVDELSVRLESHTGEVLGEAILGCPNESWVKYSTVIHAVASDDFARFVLLIKGSGSISLDVISLFPQKTFRSRPNGLRPDLAQVIADLKPKFMRFPGGCLAHGDGLGNMYRWKDTIGPIETRREQFNIWNYHQSVGLGYFEYFQFCEDIGAKPLPVVPAGCCCPNTGAKHTGLWEQGQQGIPMVDMPDYVQEILDLIEWANGPVTSTWGAKRAEAGHPEPFGLQYLGVGNEDRITPLFKERFKLIFDAVKAQYPEIIVIGTVGPRPDGDDYEDGWNFAHQLHLDMVDEHGYKEPDWYWRNLNRFDYYDRTAPAVYLGEFAAHDIGRANTLRSALAEAAYMTSLERNGDIVRLASYAPLLAKQRRTQWTPDLIYFDNTRVNLSANYYVQQLFSTNAGDIYLPVESDTDEIPENVAVSCVRNSSSGDIIMKIVNRADSAIEARINLQGELPTMNFSAICTILVSDAFAENTFWSPDRVLPVQSMFTLTSEFSFTVPACSLSVLRLSTAQP